MESIGSSNLPEVYDWRFRGTSSRHRREIWRGLIDGFFQPLISPSGTLIDFGCGRGEFISQVNSRRRIGIDLENLVESKHSEGLEVYVGPRALAGLSTGTADVVFTSNTLEHLRSKDDLLEVLKEFRRILKPGGLCIILTPNIALEPKRYWDYIDHHLPLSDRSLEEALVQAKLQPVRTIRRFLPWSTGRQLPLTYPLVRLYLFVRPAWFIFGKQSVVIAQRPKDVEL